MTSDKPIQARQHFYSEMRHYVQRSIVVCLLGNCFAVLSPLRYSQHLRMFFIQEKEKKITCIIPNQVHLLKKKKEKKRKMAPPLNE